MSRTKCAFVSLSALAVVWTCFSSTAIAASCERGLSIAILVNKDELRAQARHVFLSAVRSYACQGLMNYFSDKSNVASTVIINDVRRLPDGTEVVFENKVHAGLCGRLQYKIKREKKDQLDGLHLALSAMVLNEFRTASKEAARNADEWTEFYIPDGLAYPRPSGEYLSKAIDDLVGRLQGETSRIIPEKTPAGMTKEQVATGLGCEISIPQVVPPIVEMLKSYPDAFAAYQELSQDLETQVK